MDCYQKELTSVEVQLGHLKGVRLALFLAEGEDDDRRKVPLHDHLDDLEAVSFAAVLRAAAGSAPSFVAATAKAASSATSTPHAAVRVSGRCGNTMTRR